jgi:hypothetical protein
MNSIATYWRAALLALFLIACFGLQASDALAQAKVDKYVLTNIKNGYSALVGGTSLMGASDDATATFSLPFDFNYNDTKYTAGSTIRANSNGWVELNSTAQPAGSPYANRLYPSYTYPNTIYLWSNDCYVKTGVSYQVQGVSPNRVLVIDFVGILSYSSYSSNTPTNIEVMLYETSNIIEIHYKDNSFTMVSSHGVGLHGNNVSGGEYKVAYTSNVTPSNSFRFTPPLKLDQQASVSPKTIDFGNVAAGASSPNFAVTVTNVGLKDNLTINGASIGGTSDFAIVSSPSTNTIAPGGTATYQLRFSPLAAATRTGTFTVSTNGLDSGVQTINLTGFGIAPAVEFGPEATLFRKTRTRLGEVIEQKIVVKSTGQGPLTINPLTITGDYAGMYTATRKLTGVLAPGVTDTITVRYTPTEEGLRTATLNISTNAVQNPNKSIQLNGIGILPHLAITPRIVRFDSVAMGDTAWTTIRLTNTGSDTLAVKADYVTYFDRDFTYSGLEGADSLIAPEKFRDVQVRFTPQTQGLRQGRVRFTTNIPMTFETTRRDTSTFVVDVYGTAVPFGLIGITGPTKIDSSIIGDQVCQTVKISNNGQIPLTVNSATVSGPDAADFTITGITYPATIAAGSSIDVQVCGTPSSRGLRTAMIDVVSMSNERVTNTQLPLAVYGLQVCAQPSTNVAFENEIILVNTTSTAQIMINNCGDVATTYTAAIAGAGYTLTSPATSGLIQPGDNATFDVSFNPSTMGSLPGTLTVNGQGVTPMIINLGGVGGNVMITAANNTAPVTAVGATSAEFTVTVTNTGNMELTPGDPSISNTEFAYVAGSGPMTIAAGASGDYKFTFSPSAAGNRSATVTFPGASPALQAGTNGFILNGSTPSGSVRPVAANGYALGQNYPNPFAGQSMITFTMAEAGNAQIIVSDLIGNVVTIAADQFFSKGENTISFDATNMASGTYFYELVANGVRLQRSMLLNK